LDIHPQERRFRVANGGDAAPDRQVESPNPEANHR